MGCFVVYVWCVYVFVCGGHVCAYVNGLFWGYLCVCIYMYVNQPLFYRYTHLVKESQLDSIPGMVYCPRPGCNKRTVSDPKDNLAVCSACDLPFCKLCRQVYHGMGPCPALQKVSSCHGFNPLSLTVMFIACMFQASSLGMEF